MSTGPALRRHLPALGWALAFGVVMALVADRGSDGRTTVEVVRSTIGNLSAPWLAVPFLAGLRARSVLGGAVVGLLSTLTALSGFYLVVSAVTDLGEPTYTATLVAEVRANLLYFAWGIVSGPVCGAVGARLRGRYRRVVALVVGAALLGEPLVLGALGLASPVTDLLAGSSLPLPLRALGGWRLDLSDGAASLAVHGAELVVGAVVVALALVRRPARGTPSV